ncbi:MAG: 2-oxoacid:acceptor oxidoreductase family protein [Pelosinus sp.]|nr:2-oxoacid:acceptor oxidoreductase family protein [Pelosinus sp.]
MIEIRLSGSGGQGVITAGIILAEAAITEGKEAIQSQSYGPEARGGASKAEVIISEKFIYHPHIIKPDILLAMTQQAAEKYSKENKENTIVIVDEDLVPEPPKCSHLVKVPITRLAKEKLGKDLFANIVALGAIVKATKVVSFETIQKAVAHRVPPAFLEKNMEALRLGYEAIK